MTKTVSIAHLVLAILPQRLHRVMFFFFFTPVNRLWEDTDGIADQTDQQHILYHIICSSIEAKERRTRRELLGLMCLSSLGTILGGEALLSSKWLTPACRWEKVTELLILLCLQAHLCFSYYTILTQQFSEICPSHSLPHGDLWGVSGRPNEGFAGQHQSTNILKSLVCFLDAFPSDTLSLKTAKLSDLFLTCRKPERNINKAAWLGEPSHRTWSFSHWEDCKDMIVTTVIMIRMRREYYGRELSSRGMRHLERSYRWRCLFLSVSASCYNPSLGLFTVWMWSFHSQMSEYDHIQTVQIQRLIPICE